MGAMNRYNIGIVGCGTMGAIIAKRIASHALIDNLYAVEPNLALQRRVGRYFNAWFEHIDEQFLEKSDIVIFAIKPQDFPAVAAKMHRQSDAIGGVISIMAGVSITQLAHTLPLRNIARLMPNIAARTGKATVAVAFQQGADDAFQTLTLAVCAAIGTVFPLPEQLMHAFTAISGSGIAFVLHFMHAMTLAGIASGIKAELSEKIILNTVMGAVSLLKHESIDPPTLIKAICSAGGTTIAGIEALEAGGLTAAVMQAVRETKQRSEALSNRS